MFKNCNALPINYQVMIFQNSTSKILIPRLTISPCDAVEPWKLGFQDAASLMMQGIMD
jgi:hypothetical protein